MRGQGELDDYSGNFSILIQTRNQVNSFFLRNLRGKLIEQEINSNLFRGFFFSSDIRKRNRIIADVNHGQFGPLLHFFHLRLQAPFNFFRNFSPIKNFMHMHYILSNWAETSTVRIIPLFTLNYFELRNSLYSVIASPALRDEAISFG